MGMTATDIIEVLPSILVGLGLFAVWAVRRKPVAVVGTVLGGTDLVWCGVSLFAKQLSFLAEARIELHQSAVWGSLLGALLPALGLMVIPSRRWRVWASWGVAAFGSLVILADSVYGRWFGDVFSAVALLAAGQMGRVAGGAWSLVVGRDAWLIIDMILAVPLMVAVSRMPEIGRAGRHAPRAAALVGGVVLLVAGWRTTAAVRADPTLMTQRFSNRALVGRTGPLVYHALDGWWLLQRTVARTSLTEEAFNDVRTWFAERQPQRAGVGPWFGVAEGKSLVVIQVESLQAPMVGLRINGREVMPNLLRLQSASLSFPQVFDQTDEGRTSDAEWLSLASLLPEPQGAAAFIDAGNHLVGLPSVLAAKGYQSLSAVAFEPSFWNRRIMHPSFGFSRSYFEADFGPGEVIGWGLNDRDFFLQMVPRLTSAPGPFVAWLITESLHYPFETFPDLHKHLDVRPWNDTPFGNYIHGMHYFDLALGDFLAALERGGLLEHTVVVVTGDHSVGFPWNRDIAHALGFPHDMLQWHLAERVPFVVRVPGGLSAEVAIPAGQVDIAPTLLALLGVDPARLPYVGRNLLGNPGAEPVVRRDGSWVDARHLFLAKSTTNGTHCYDLGTRGDVPLAACAEGSTRAGRQTEISRRVVEFDLQQRLVAGTSAGAPRKQVSVQDGGVSRDHPGRRQRPD